MGASWPASLNRYFTKSSWCTNLPRHCRPLCWAFLKERTRVNPRTTSQAGDPCRASAHADASPHSLKGANTRLYAAARTQGFTQSILKWLADWNVKSQLPSKAAKFIQSPNSSQVHDPKQQHHDGHVAKAPVGCWELSKTHWFRDIHK